MQIVILHGMELFDQTVSVMEKFCAAAGEGDAPAAAFQQGKAQFTFQLLDRLADSGLRDK